MRGTVVSTAIGAEILDAEIVRQNENDVWRPALSGRRNARRPWNDQKECERERRGAGHGAHYTALQWSVQTHRATFNTSFHPDRSLAAVEVHQAAGVRVSYSLA